MAEWMIHIGERNRQGEYSTIADVIEDLEVLSSLIQKDAHPEVLIDGIVKELRQYDDSTIDEELLGRVEIG